MVIIQRQLAFSKTIVLGTQKNRLTGTVLLNSQIIMFQTDVYEKKLIYPYHFISAVADPEGIQGVRPHPRF